MTVGVTNITPTGIQSPEKIDGARDWLDLTSFPIGNVLTNTVTMPISLYWWSPPATEYGVTGFLPNTFQSTVNLTYATGDGIPVQVPNTRPPQFLFGSPKVCHVWYGYSRPGGGIAAREVVGTETLGGVLTNFESIMVVSEDSTSVTFSGVMCGRVNIAGLSNPRPYVPGGYTTRAGGLIFVATIPFSWNGFDTTLVAHPCTSFLDTGYGWQADIQMKGVAS